MMDALDYAYEWLEETCVERNRQLLDEDSALIAAFVAGFEAAQQSVRADTPTVCPKCGGWLKGGECENCNSPLPDQHSAQEEFCPACKGVGYMPSGWNPTCGQCNGTGKRG